MADIEVAVGRQDHAVDGLLGEIRLGQRIGLADALGAGGAAAGRKFSSAAMILRFLGPLVGSSTTPAEPA